MNHRVNENIGNSNRERYVFILWECMWIFEYVNNDEYVVMMYVYHDWDVWNPVNKNEIEGTCLHAC